MTIGGIGTVGLVACIALSTGCGGGAPRAVTTTTTTAPAPTTTIDPVAGAGLAHGFNHALGTANGALFAFGQRLAAGVNATGASLPADFVSSASALATAELAVAGALKGSTWPAGVQPLIDQVVADLRTFAADLQLVSSLAPSLLPDWQRQFTRDGATLNAAEDAVRVALGAAPGGA